MQKREEVGHCHVEGVDSTVAVERGRESVAQWLWHRGITLARGGIGRKEGAVL